MTSPRSLFEASLALSCFKCFWEEGREQEDSCLACVAAGLMYPTTLLGGQDKGVVLNLTEEVRELESPQPVQSNQYYQCPLPPHLLDSSG